LPKDIKLKPNQAKKIAEETLRAIEENQYKNTSGRTIVLDKMVQRSIMGSKLYKPDWNFDPTSLVTNNYPTICITRESTLQAASRLKHDNICVLNFASAKHPGGGFLRGSLAQEESIARSSALYQTLIKHPEYYEENKRSQKDNIGMYLDYAIYSPDVPVIRNDKGDWLDEPYLMAVVTSPAPNRSAMLMKSDDADKKVRDDIDLDTLEKTIEKALDRRMCQILSIMAKHGHRTIVLGAWGCGVFGNDPLLVAELFKENLKKLPFFDRVAFPIYDRSDSDTFRSFVQMFGPAVDCSF